jgi:hypothetical protein
MSAHKDFWERVKKTDPKRVKAITGKQYKGNSPQPYYMVERMTEEFGMCGIGWGLNILNERMERLTDTDVLHVAVVELWYKQGEKTGSITQIGQTKAAYKKSDANYIVVDEDAPKKSVTDALTKCMSYLGFAGDIFSGQWDDSKYVQELNKEFSQVKSIQNTEAPKPVFTEERMTSSTGCKTTTKCWKHGASSSHIPRSVIRSRSTARNTSHNHRKRQHKWD